MEGMKAIPYIFLVIAIAGIVGGASALVLSKFGDTTSDVDATNAINNATSAVGDIAEQLPTVAIIGIMVIIISIIAGVFVYLRYFQ
jgi:predicted benzoate:H+ symporter BenE